MTDIKIELYYKTKYSEGIKSIIMSISDEDIPELMKMKASDLEKNIKYKGELEECKILSFLKTEDIITRFD